jgi:hypothetical protein
MYYTCEFFFDFFLILPKNQGLNLSEFLFLPKNQAYFLFRFGNFQRFGCDVVFCNHAGRLPVG